MNKVKIFILIILILSIIFAICFFIPTLREKIIYFLATRKTFVKVNDIDILDNIKTGKIGLYLDEFIPNIKINLNV